MTDTCPRCALGETTAHLGLAALSAAEGTCLVAFALLAMTGAAILAGATVYHLVGSYRDRPRRAR